MPNEINTNILPGVCWEEGFYFPLPNTLNSRVPNYT